MHSLFLKYITNTTSKIFKFRFLQSTYSNFLYVYFVRLSFTHTIYFLLIMFFIFFFSLNLLSSLQLQTINIPFPFYFYNIFIVAQITFLDDTFYLYAILLVTYIINLHFSKRYPLYGVFYTIL